MPRRLVMPLARTCLMTGATFSANRLASAAVRAAPSVPAAARLVRLSSVAPCPFCTASAARVRSEIMRRSFSARAA